MKNALPLVALTLVLAACGGSDASSDAMPEAAPATPAPTVIGTVTITSPAEGSTVSGTTVVVELASTVQIVPAGDMTPRTGHHHLYLDADLTTGEVPVPTVPGSIVHMGNAASTFTFENVAPGRHRLIAVVADGVHVPLQPWVVDTVMFTVR
jgi:hypothetical protein